MERAIEWALKASPVDYHCRSDFGYAFNRFSHTELESLDRKTTVLILGDARNNYNDPQAWAHPPDPRAREGHHLAQPGRASGAGASATA